MKHYVVYSHGFGVRKDDRGLFTDIAAAMPGTEHILFDYNEVSEDGTVLTVNPLQEQVRRLRDKLASLNDGTEKTIDIVAHSQGCVVAALAKPQKVRRILCLAPPDNMDTERLIHIFGSRKGGVINLDGESRIPRRDGTTTIVPKQYWQSIQVNVKRLYNHLPNLAEVKFYIANHDEVLGTTDFDAVDQRIELVKVPGNHDFTDEARSEIIKIVKEALRPPE